VRPDGLASYPLRHRVVSQNKHDFPMTRLHRNASSRTREISGTPPLPNCKLLNTVYTSPITGLSHLTIIRNKLLYTLRITGVLNFAHGEQTTNSVAFIPEANYTD
jgi:hypothetical protein